MKKEDYVKYLLNRQTFYLSQFRICILPLQVETGRFRNVKEGKRKCLVCNKDDIENKFHILCVFHAYIEF